MAIFLVICGLASAFSPSKNQGFIEVKSILSDSTHPPVGIIVNVAQGAELIDSEALTNASDQSSPSKSAASNGNDLSFSDNFASLAAFQAQSEAIGPAFANISPITYIVQKGDTLANIANVFHVSDNSIISENSIIRKNAVEPGELLNILPAIDVVYTVQDGDTISSISSQFHVSRSKLTQFNQSINFSSLSTGDRIIIPGGLTISAPMTQNNTLPNFNSFFIMPAKGYNWGILHNYNAVDIANSCGTPVVASADGVVVPDPNIPDVLGGWNGGYGNFVLIKHDFGNNISTRYAHLEQVMVQIGDYVQQGQEIGLMGESGEATGCHVHFEVIGAQNPFGK